MCSGIILIKSTAYYFALDFEVTNNNLKNTRYHVCPKTRLHDHCPFV